MSTAWPERDRERDTHRQSAPGPLLQGSRKGARKVLPCLRCSKARADSEDSAFYSSNSISRPLGVVAGPCEGCERARLGLRSFFFGARGVSLAGRAQRLTTIFSKRLLKDNVAHLLIVSIAAAVSCERPGSAGAGGGAMAASFLAALQAVEKDKSRVRDTRLARAVRAKTHAAARATSALQSLVRDTSQVVQDAAVRRRDLLVIDSEKAVASTPCVSGRGKLQGVGSVGYA